MKKAIENTKNLIKKDMLKAAEARAKIRASSGRDRHDAWNEKRRIGDGTRTLFLVYGCLRGRSYITIEPKCAKDNEMSPRSLLSNIHEILGKEAPERSEWTLERVKTWLIRPNTLPACARPQPSINTTP